MELHRNYFIWEKAIFVITSDSQIASYLANAEIDYLKKDSLYAQYAIVYTKYLLEMKDYNEALSIADSNRHKMVQNSDDSALLELTFLTSLGYYYTGEIETAYTYFKNTFYAAHSIESCYATICRNYVLSRHLFSQMITWHKWMIFL